MQIVHLPHGAAPIDHAPDWLEVRRGRTRFPRRPLIADRFLIGSGSNCHLQLGGGIPMLHSLLVREENNWALEAIAAEPGIFVNACPVRRQSLAVGDAIQITEFEFILRCGNGGHDRGHHAQHQKLVDASADDNESVDRLSSLELVNRLEQQFDLIETLEDSPAGGATALLRAIRRRRGRLAITESDPTNNRPLDVPKPPHDQFPIRRAA